MAIGKTTTAGSDVSSTLATNIIRGSLEKLAREVKVFGFADKVVIVGNFGDEPEERVTLRYLVNGNSVRGPNPDRFGTITKGDIAVSQIEEDLCLDDFEQVSMGNRYNTYLHKS